MIKGMHGLLYSSEPEAVRAFIRDKLQLPFTDVGDGWLIFDVPEGDLGVHPTGDDASLSGTHDISFYTDDVEATVAELESRGVALEPIADQGYGLVTYFTMPGDLRVQLYQPKYDKAKAARSEAYEGKASMLVRKPAADVFEAIVDPAITSRFWFTKGSGRLEPGARVRWEWEMYGVSAEVRVLEIEPNARVLVEWGPRGGPPTTVEWLLTPRADGTTYVTVTQRGFRGTEDAIVRQAIDATGGFAFHLAGLKALLEHDVELGLTGDHHPTD